MVQETDESSSPIMNPTHKKGLRWEKTQTGAGDVFGRGVMNIVMISKNPTKWCGVATVLSFLRKCYSC